MSGRNDIQSEPELRSAKREAQRSRRGRPRDPGLDRAILDSAFSLMVETGIRGFSVREVARRSGIPKSSIYRRWPTRAELLSAVLSRLAADETAPDTGSIRSDLIEVVRKDIQSLNDSGSALPRVALESRDDPELAPVVREVVNERRSGRRPVFERAVERGEVDRSVDFDSALDMLQGMLWSRLITHRTLAENDADDIVDCALHGFASNGRH